MVIDLEDVSALWCLRMEKSEFMELWGACAEELAEETALSSMRQQEEAATQHRGGGRCRAFVSKLSKRPEYRKPNGKIDIAAIMLAWDEELRNPTGILDDCKEVGSRATLARRGQVESGTNLHEVSSFGNIRDRAKKRSRKEINDEITLDQLDAANSGQPLESSEDLLAMVVYTDMKHTFLQLALANHAGDIREQYAAIDRLSKKLATRQRLEEEDFMARERQKLQEQGLGTVDMHALQDACGCKFRVMERSHPSSVAVTYMRPWINMRRWAENKVAKWAEERGRGSKHLQDQASKLWKQEHVMEPNPEVLADIPADAKPTYCSEMGYGTCLCSGDGYVLRLAKDKLASRLAGLCPKGSIDRSWAKRGFLVLQINDAMYHISILYLRPQRPTFTKMLPNGEAWGRRLVVPDKDSTGKLNHYLDFAALEEHDLKSALSFTLWKLVHFNKMGAEVASPWVPSAKLTLEPFHQHSSRTSTSSFPFWYGAAAELKAAAERDERKKQRDVTRREREAAGLAPPKRENNRRKGRKAPQKQNQKGSSQKRHAAEVRNLMPIENVAPDKQVSDADDARDLFSSESSESGESNVDAAESLDEEARLLWKDLSVASLKEDAAKTVGDGAFHLSGDEGSANASEEEKAIHDLFSSDCDGEPLPEGVPPAPATPKAMTEIESLQGSPAKVDALASPAGKGSPAPSEGVAVDPGNEPSDSSSDSSDSSSSSLVVVETKGNLLVDQIHDHEGPPGSQFRRMKREEVPVAWYGKLPIGKVDDGGVKSRTRFFGPHIRSKEDARVDVLSWLRLWS